MLVPVKPFQPSFVHSSLFGPFVSYKEKEVLWILPLFWMLMTFFVTNEEAV